MGEGFPGLFLLWFVDKFIYLVNVIQLIWERRAKTVSFTRERPWVSGGIAGGCRGL